ncbi:MAG: hypothetical protein IJX18_01300, partial [Clostridia bacterium]|nr:hypothetical protein [Clostridia bacterium]
KFCVKNTGESRRTKRDICVFTRQKNPEEIVTYLYGKGVLIAEIKRDKIGLEEYYSDLMKEGVANAENL